MRKVLMLPTPQQARNDTSNSINQIVLHLALTLPEYGYELTENRGEADLIAGHAGQTHSDIHADVAHCHGLYPTAYPNLVEPWHTSANQSVVNNLITARSITCPSEWVADILRRDMHVSPTIVPWAIDFEAWKRGENQGYVLWNKTRKDGVCDPTPIFELAKRLPSISFISTFAPNPVGNLRIIDRQPFHVMKSIVQNAGVYLATTKETFCISALEAMASGVPVLGYKHGNVPNLVAHGVTGYLVEPGDIDGLAEGLAYCFRHREQLGANAREMARLFTWDKVARMIAGVYDGLFETPLHPKVSVVIPCFNYAQYIGEAINSVAEQVTGFNVELIIVDDGSTDGSRAAINEALARPGFDINQKLYDAKVIDQPNSGVAAARNRGISQATGDYIVCLDADDRLGDPAFLKLLADALDADRSLGIAFTGLLTIDADGKPGQPSAWPHGFSWERQLEGGNQIPTCCMFRRVAWRRAGGYKSQYQPAEDAELWTRIIALGFGAKHVVEAPWFHYRIHPGSLSDTIRQGQRPEPDWRTDKPWVNDKQYPCAANGIARPVRNYDKPKVAIIVPCADYHIPFLAQALDSIERQTERYWECIVVNDTTQPLPLVPYPWARLVSTEGGRGAGFARNLGVKSSTAPFVTFLDADDILMPTFLEKALRQYQATGRYIYTDWLSVNKNGQLEEHKTPEFVVGDVFSKPTPHAINVLVKRAWHDQVGGFDESMTTWEDVDYFMRLAKAGICGARVAEPLFIYRYLTGQRREQGERIKAQVIASFNTKYREYIQGEKMCGCSNAVPAAQLKNQNGTQLDPAQLVRISYQPDRNDWHFLMVDKTNYGYHQKGDTFYVRAEHAQRFPDRFVPISEVFEEKVKTPVPPPPPAVRQTDSDRVLV